MKHKLCTFGITVVFSLAFISLSLAQVSSPDSGFPGGGTSMFNAGDNPSLSSAFGTSNTSPPPTGTANQGSLPGTPAALGGTNAQAPFPSSGASNQAVTSDIPAGLGGTNVQGTLPPSGASDQGFAADTPRAIGGTGAGLAATTPGALGGTMGTTGTGQSSAASATQGSLGTTRQAGGGVRLLVLV